MDISNHMMDDYEMKRGNYVVESHNSVITISSNDTSTRILTSSDNRTEGFSDGKQTTSRVRTVTVRYGQTTDGMRNEDCVQGKPISPELIEQIIGSARSLAINVGSEELVYIKANFGSPRLCSTSLRVVVQSTQVSPRKELVLNEPA